MIAFFPDIYPDELIYSVIARYHQRSGYARLVSTFDDVYQQKATIPSFEFVNAYTPDALTWITKNCSFEEVIMQQTMFPFYAAFLPLEKKKRAYDAMLKQEGNPSNFLGIKRTGARYFRYCPRCAYEDRARLGETFWHRAHQIQKLYICPFHGCYLQNTNIKISSRQSPALYDAESIVPYDCVSEDCLYIGGELARYVYDVLSSPVQFVRSDIGGFLHYHLNKKYLVKEIARDFSNLYNDFSEFYSGFQVPEPWQVQKIFSGYSKDPYYICQLAFWEGISPKDLIANNELYIDTDTQEFYMGLAQKYSLDVGMVSEIGREISKHLYEQNRIHRKPGRRGFDYAKMDVELLPKVKAYVKDLYSKEGRPEKLSFRKVEKALSLPQKRFNYLPKCKKYIERHWESQPEFWAREVVWAVKDVQLDNLTINWKNIHLKTSLRFSNLEACYPYIKDTETKQIIGNVIATLSSQDNS